MEAAELLRVMTCLPPIEPVVLALTCPEGLLGLRPLWSYHIPQISLALGM